MTPDEARTVEREALLDADTAEATAAELQERLEGGDASITAEQLGDAHRFAIWARSHAKGATARRVKSEDQAALEAARTAIEGAGDIDTSDAELVAAWTAAVDALRILAEQSVTRSNLVLSSSGELDNHREILARRGLASLDELGALPSRIAEAGQGYRIPARGVNVANVRPVDMIATALEVGVGSRVDLSGMVLDRDRGRTLPDTSLAPRVIGWADVARERIGGH